MRTFCRKNSVRKTHVIASYLLRLGHGPLWKRPQFPRNALVTPPQILTILTSKQKSTRQACRRGAMTADNLALGGVLGGRATALRGLFRMFRLQRSCSRRTWGQHATSVDARRSGWGSLPYSCGGCGAASKPLVVACGPSGGGRHGGAPQCALKIPP